MDRGNLLGALWVSIAVVVLVVDAQQARVLAKISPKELAPATAAGVG